MSLPLFEALEDEHRRKAELAPCEALRTSTGDSDAPGRHLASTKFLTRLDVDHGHRAGEDRAGAEHGALPHPGTLGHDGPAADHALVTDHHGSGLRRFEHTTDPDATRQMDVLADLGTRTDGGPRVDHGAFADIGTNVGVARHHHHARGLIATPPGLGSGHHADTALHVVALERNLVGVLERCVFDGLHLGDLEQQQDGVFAPLVHGDRAVGVPLRDTGHTGVEGVDRLVHGGNDLRVVDAQAVAALPQAFDPRLQITHGAAG